MATERTDGLTRTLKAQKRRETMARFNAQVEAEKERLGALDLPLEALVDLFHCGNFVTELAARHWVEVRNATDAEAVMAAMLEGMSHPKWKVRRTCADFMDHNGDQRCVELLLNALKDPMENVRRLALHSLFCQPCKVRPLEGDFVPQLIAMATSDQSLRARRIATGTLGNYLHDGRAAEALRRLAQENQDAVVASRARALLDRLPSNHPISQIKSS